MLILYFTKLKYFKLNFPHNIAKEHLLKAIEKIDKEGIPKDGDSQYYDVIYNGNKYPPKLIVSYANLFANGEILDRNSFNGGLNTQCFILLEKNEFVIENKSIQEGLEPKVWFVTQGSTFTSEIGKKFLFAPSKGSGDKTRFYWDNVLRVKKGDIIFNYSEGLKGVSIAICDGYKATNNDPSNTWNKEGYRVDIELVPLNPFITREVIRSHQADFYKLLSSVVNKPFTSEGKINQGYLYEFSGQAGRFIRDIYGKLFGNPTIDEFFDKVNLTPLNHNKLQVMRSKSDYKLFKASASASNLYLSENLDVRFIASLLTKPFVILTGLSGSGKTKLAQAFAMWICENESQYAIVPVGADWTNREPLLGFPNALQAGEYIKPDNGVLDLIIAASNNISKPFFLILDEMNLSHVERYFADFLSVMESHGKISLHAGNENWNDVPSGINLPSNLFIVGTVNIDETTYMFSPKVLDRASVIEFRVTAAEMKNYLENTKPLDLDSLKGAGAGMANAFVAIANDETIEPESAVELNNTLIDFFSELKKTSAEFGFRSASEILRFAGVINKIEGANWTLPQIIDAAIMQKLLPKVHGSRRKLEPVLKTLGALCLHDGQNMDDFISAKIEINFADITKIKYPLSLEKILRMYYSLISNGFTSYAEA